MSLINQVFLKNRDEYSPPVFPLIDIISGIPRTKGEVGIEIEVEGKNFPHEVEHIGNKWRLVGDGSLRGEESGEYVLKKPLDFKQIPKALDELWAGFEKKKTKFDESNRTSVHVHLNCQNFLMNRLASFSALYFVLEEVLTEWCGEYRVGNLFCLRTKDAPAIVENLIDFIKADGGISFSNGLHYSGFNISALRKFGSIEIRTMRGTDNKELIQEWIDILERLYVLSGEYEDPSEIVGLFSSSGPIGFFETVLGASSQVVRNGAGMTEQEISDSMYDGIRIAQDLCYCLDWGQYNKRLRAESDPFKRSGKKLSESMEQYLAETGPATPVAGSSLFQLSPAVPATEQTLTSLQQEIFNDEYPEEEYDHDDDEYYDDDE